MALRVRNNSMKTVLVINPINSAVVQTLVPATNAIIGIIGMPLIFKKVGGITTTPDTQTPPLQLAPGSYMISSHPWDINLVIIEIEGGVQLATL